MGVGFPGLDHNGAIFVDSDESGTVFTLLFPLSPELRVSEYKPRHLEGLRGKGFVLVVDDEPQQREIAKSMLKTLGYDVATVTNGEEAITFLRSNAVDLVLLAMIMYPGMNGLQTYENIIKIHPGQKAIIVSGYSESKEVLQARELGVGEFIGKPFNLEQLGYSIRKIMGQQSVPHEHHSSENGL